MKLVIIEDESSISEIIRLTVELQWPDAEVLSSHLGREGIGLVRSERPDAVILDLGLPDLDGYDVLKQIRTFSKVPILILTARGEEADITRGLESGADDYVVKPFRRLEILARIQALFREPTRG